MEDSSHLVTPTVVRDISHSDVVAERVRLRTVDAHHIVIYEADLRGVYLGNVTLRGAELNNVQINAELHDVVINGVDIAPLIEAELDRREPQRVLLRATTADGLREGWAMVCDQWAGTMDRARALPEDLLHASVDGEWSFIQTLRHLGFATATWLQVMIQGERAPWQPLDLPWDEAPGWPGVPWDRDARPSLDEALVARVDRQQRVSAFLATLTDDDLARLCSSDAPAAPTASVPVAECLRVILNEEYLHHSFAVRDLDALTAQE